MTVVRRIDVKAAIIIAVSVVLRLIIVVRGGAYYCPDAYIFTYGQRAADYLIAGNLAKAFGQLHHFFHALFSILAVPLTLLDRAVNAVTGLDSHLPSFTVPGADTGLPSILILSMVSVANVWLISRLTYNLTQSKVAADWALLLAASTSTLFYYSRFLLPYDTSLCFALIAILFGVRPGNRLSDVVWCGLFSLCAFTAYNGYWTISGLALLVPALRPGDPFAVRVQRWLLASLVFLVPLLFVLAGDSMLLRLVSSKNLTLLQTAMLASNTVTQGVYSEGWSLPFAYLWHAEHLLLILWLACLVATPIYLWRRRRPESAEGVSDAHALVLAAACGVLTYLALVAFSVGMHKFVINGRLARQVVPFLIIVSAALLSRVSSAKHLQRLHVPGILAAMIFLNAAWNFFGPLQHVFPDDFTAECNRIIARNPGKRFEIVNGHIIYPVPTRFSVGEGDGAVVRESLHYVNFLPDQYERYTPEERARIRSGVVKMQLVERD